MLEHGKFNITISKNLVVIELFDSFNEQAANHAICELKKICGEFDEGFYLLEIAEKYTGATPEVLNMVSSLTTWLTKHKCLARALVFPDHVLLKIANLYEPELFSGILPTRHFETRQQALAWLDGFRTDKATSDKTV